MDGLGQGYEGVESREGYRRILAQRSPLGRESMILRDLGGRSVFEDGS